MSTHWRFFPILEMKFPYLKWKLLWPADWEPGQTFWVYLSHPLKPVIFKWWSHTVSEIRLLAILLCYTGWPAPLHIAIMLAFPSNFLCNLVLIQLNNNNNNSDVNIWVLELRSGSWSRSELPLTGSCGVLSTEGQKLFQYWLWLFLTH